jgi:transcriptional regulator with XRE-family HTH domain
MEELAAAAGVHANTLGQIERGERNPSLSALAGIAAGLKIELPVLFDVVPPVAARVKAQLIKRVEGMTPAQARAVIRILDAATDL